MGLPHLRYSNESGSFFRRVILQMEHTVNKESLCWENSLKVDAVLLAGVRYIKNLPHMAGRMRNVSFM